MPQHPQTIREATEAELFRLLIENIQDYAIFVVDPEGRVRSWNPGAERLLGYSEAEIIGQSIALFCTPENVQDGVVQREMSKAVETGRGEDERWHVRKDGSLFWSGGTITPLWDEEHNLRGFAKIMRDRTSQKQNADALKDALAYTHGVVDTVREPLLVLGGDLRVKTANRSFYQTFRVSVQETENRLIYHLGDGQWNIPRLRTLLEEILPRDTSFDGFEVEHEFGALGRKVMLLNARRFYREGNHTELILLAIEDVTERKRAENERREIETRFTSLVKNIKDHAILTMDLDGRVTSWNEAAERILGYSEAEILGQPFSLIFIPEDLQDNIPARELRQAIEVGRGEDERWHVRKGGERFWATGVVTPTHDSTGRHTGFSKILRDITERKQAEKEEALKESEKRFQELTAHLHQVLWIMDAQESKMLYVSPGYEKMWGRSCQSLIDHSTSYFEGIHPLDQEMMLREYAAMFRTGDIDVEFRILRPDESVNWVWMRGYPVSEQGRVVRLVGIIEDVTEKRLLAGQRDALLARLQLQIERMPLAYILFDAEPRVIDWNPAAERIFGYAKREALGISPSDFFPPSFRREADEILRRIRGGDMSVHSVNENVTKDGRTITCEWLNTPLFEEDGRFAGILCLTQDVTERLALEEQFRQAQKMEAFGQLAGGVAHDFNNLLTVISGYSELLLEILPPADPNREMIQEILNAGVRAALLTRQLLAFSRKQLVQLQVLDLNALVASTEKMLGRLIGEDMNLTTVLAPGLDRVKVDPGQVEQVIMNLVVNARDAMPEGGKIMIETANVDLDESYAHSHVGVKPGRYVLLAVSDAGCGMSEEVKARIFEPFFTTKEVGKGTGLGLATVFGIVKQSGGQVSVHSEVGRGTAFKIYLPSVADVIPATQAESAPVLTGAETILLVEDEKAVRAMAGLALQTNGYMLVVAADGEEAIRLCEQHPGPIHLLVTDVVMPRMGGRQLAERLTVLHPETRVLFLSGYTDDAVVRHGVLQSQVQFLQKPFTVDALTRKVRAVLDGVG
jgi:two-component system, cell cycle sensor histidine kinase and response regulator CckA